MDSCWLVAARSSRCRVCWSVGSVSPQLGSRPTTEVVGMTASVEKARKQNKGRQVSFINFVLRVKHASEGVRVRDSIESGQLPGVGSSVHSKTQDSTHALFDY